MNGSQVGGIQQPATTQTPTASGAGITPGNVGKNHAGQQVAATNPESALQNAAEEISMAAAGRKNPRDLKVSKGKTGSERQLELIEKIKIVEEVQGVDDFKKKFPKDLKENFKSEDYLEGAEDQFKDPYHQYVALYELAVDFKSQPGDEIFQAIEALEQKHPQYIEIGKGISEAAGKLAEKYDGASYSEINNKVFGHVKDHKSLAAEFKGLSNNQDSASFETSLGIRLSQLSSELNMMTSTTEDTHLRSVINDMTALKRLVGIHDSCMETEGVMRRSPNNIEQFDGHQYMANVLDVLDQTLVTDSTFESLLNQMGMGEQTIQVKTALANQTASLIRDIPEEIFANEQVKGSMAGAILDLQSSLSLAEEGGEATDESYGKIGDREVNVDGFVRSGDILGDLGVSITGDKQLPEFMTTHDAPALGQQSEASGTNNAELTAGGQVQPGSASAAGLEEPSNADTPAPDAITGTSPEVPAKSEIDGLSDKGLISRQDKLLNQALQLQQQKDTDFVFGSSLTALEHALTKDPDTLSALGAIASERGKGVYAKGLKIAITPEGSGKELRLMPPDQKALQAWAAQNPDKSVADLVRTAITVLKENRDPDFDFEKINNDLASLKESISQIDSKIKKKPFSRPQGAEAFDRLEYSHKFSISADRKNAGAVLAEADTPGKESDAAQKEKARVALNDQNDGLARDD